MEWGGPVSRSGHRAPLLLCRAGDADRCPLLDDIVETPEAVMARGRVLKHDATTTVVIVGDEQRHWVIKRYNTKNRWHAIRRTIRRSRAFNCWHAAVRLQAIGIDTPRPVAVLEERRFGMLRGRSYFVCEHVEGCSLEYVLRHHSGDKARLMDQAATVVVRLRQHRIAHGDLKATNFIVGDEHLFLVDLDATRHGPGRAVTTGLRKDLQRFMKNWVDDPDLSSAFQERLGHLAGSGL